MSNYKIRVNGEAESKEAQELFVVLGATCCSGLERNKNVNFLFMNSGFVTACKLQENFDKSRCKEITLPELRDLVVLKRNDVGDATHKCETSAQRLGYLASGGIEYIWSYGNSIWFKPKEMNFKSLNIKPIKKKEMKAKEYLKKIGNNEYMLMDGAGYSGQDNWIEIPEWAVAYADHKNGHGFFYDSFCKIASFYNIVWSRHTQPEELPFIDDESSLGNSKIGRRAITVKIPVESLNSQYAEIETVRQSAWQKQEGGSHYKNLKIQPMQYALENKLDYAQANVVKYVTRHKEKNGKEDLLKAIHNIELMIEFYYGDEK